MNININFENNEITNLKSNEKISLYSPEGFKLISDLWVKVGWDQKYLYSFTWLGRPIIQIPDDMLRIQEVIYNLKPDIIIETGIAHGGSLILSASLCKCVGRGKVIGIDIEIRAQNRKSIEEHELFEYITLIEGNSISLDTFKIVSSYVKSSDNVIVILDSCHSYSHVLSELKLYSNLVSIGSYIVVTDGSQEYLNQTPRAKMQYQNASNWGQDNPKKAAEDFVNDNKNFIIEEPSFLFNEGNIDFRVTHWPSAFVKKIK